MDPEVDHVSPDSEICSDTEAVDYAASKPDETENDDENGSPDDSVSDETSSDDSSSDESMDEEGNKIYKEADLDIARFIIKMRLAFNAQHEVDFNAVDYLMILFKKFKAFKTSNLYSVIREEMTEFKTTHKFASSSEVLENALEVRRIFIQNLFTQVEDDNGSDC